MNPYKYPLEVFWDEGSEAFICITPDLPGCSAVGQQFPLQSTQTSSELIGSNKKITTLSKHKKYP